MGLSHRTPNHCWNLIVRTTFQSQPGHSKRTRYSVPAHQPQRRCRFSYLKFQCIHWRRASDHSIRSKDRRLQLIKHLSIQPGETRYNHPHLGLPQRQWPRASLHRRLSQWSRSQEDEQCSRQKSFLYTRFATRRSSVPLLALTSNLITSSHPTPDAYSHRRLAPVRRLPTFSRTTLLTRSISQATWSRQPSPLPTGAAA